MNKLTGTKSEVNKTPNIPTGKRLTPKKENIYRNKNQLTEHSDYLLRFFKAIDDDPRIGVTHITLYCTLYNMGLQQDFLSIFIMAPELMKMAKISGLGTYHRCIKDLHDFGYINYEPSFNHRKKSKILLR